MIEHAIRIFRKDGRGIAGVSKEITILAFTMFSIILIYF